MSPFLADLLRIAYAPSVLASFTTVSVALFLKPLSDKPAPQYLSHALRRRLLWLSPAVCLTFVTEATLYFIQAGYNESFWPAHNAMVYTLTSVLLWGSFSVMLFESSDPRWPSYLSSWTLAALVDTALLALLVNEYTLGRGWGYAHGAIHFVRIFILTGGAWYIYFASRPSLTADTAVCSDETQSLLSGSTASSPYQDDTAATVSYGSVGDETGSDTEVGDDDDEEEVKRLQKQRLQEEGGWIGYLKGFLIFVPYIMPYGDTQARFWLVVMGLCISMKRVLTLLIPLQTGHLIKALAATAITGIVPWKQLLIWSFLQFPLSEAVSLLKSIADTRVSHFSYQKLNEVAFSHVMGLSMDYHTSKSSGKVVKAIEQGCDIRQVLHTVFTFVPTMVDLVVAVVYLTFHFDFYMGLIILTTTVLHTYVAGKGNLLATSFEREYSEKTRAESEVLYDSITNWQTVAYHNRGQFEQERYASAVRASVLAQRRCFDYFAGLYSAQHLVMKVGLLSVCVLAAKRIAAGSATISDFVFLTAYWGLIQGPMTTLGWSFRQTAEQLINAEWLFQLLMTKPSIQDKPGARDIEIKGGRVEFENVSFAYDPARPILQDVSFTAEPGQSIALVGETGGGKSTTLRLLYRFYDATSGSIKIDGQDLRDVTLNSLRESLGAVPQDPSVFDQTVMENLKYAKPGATEEQIHAACKAARIHDQILTFPNGYNTRVGERGVQLSGGELQRIAIARVILRAPKVVVLDEATSAVDSDTEATVQQAIKALSVGRTVFTVAHRLSTIVSADVILVIDGGRVAERGSHAELLLKGGKYARLWAMQTAAHAGISIADDQDILTD